MYVGQGTAIVRWNMALRSEWAGTVSLARAGIYPSSFSWERRGGGASFGVVVQVKYLFVCFLALRQWCIGYK